MHPGHEPHRDQYDDAANAYCTGRVGEAAAGFGVLVDGGCPAAPTYLAQFYIRGEGVPQDVEKRLELLRLAVSWGYGKAAFNLGALHRSGDCGFPRGAGASRRYFISARSLGCEISVEPFLQ